MTEPNNVQNHIFLVVMVELNDMNEGKRAEKYYKDI